jgi:hypothetical protein
MPPFAEVRIPDVTAPLVALKRNHTRGLSQTRRSDAPPVDESAIVPAPEASEIATAAKDAFPPDMARMLPFAEVSDVAVKAFVAPSVRSVAADITGAAVHHQRGGAQTGSTPRST